MSTARVARSVKLDPEIDARLTALAQRTGRTKSFYMNRAIESALEEIELAYSLQAELEDIRSGRAASVSLDEAVEDPWAWRAELSPRALKQLSKLDKPTARRIVDYLRETASGEDPRVTRKGLTHLQALRYRVGNYRIIASIEDDELLILAINIDHRSRIYR